MCNSNSMWESSSTHWSMARIGAGVARMMMSVSRIGSVHRTILLSSGTKFDVKLRQRGWWWGWRHGEEGLRERFLHLQCLEDDGMPWRGAFKESVIIFFVGGSLVGSSLLLMVAHLRRVVMGEWLSERERSQYAERWERWWERRMHKNIRNPCLSGMNTIRVSSQIPS